MAVMYEPLRLIAGMTVAAVLVAVAGWLIATTDWSEPNHDVDPLDERL
jgi:hypothetical protein